MKKSSLKTNLAVFAFALTASITQAVAAENSKTTDIFDKKNFSIGIRGELSKSNFSFDTPAGHSILKWQDMSGKGLGLDLGYKFDDKFDVFFSHSVSTSKGNGTDDDISNLGGAYSVQSATGRVSDTKIGLNIKAYEKNSLSLSPRVGYFYKNARLKMNDGKVIDISKGESCKIGTNCGILEISGLGQRTDSKFQGAFIGVKLDKKSSEDAINTLIFDFYPMTSYRGKQYWPQREPQDQNWSLSSVSDKDAGSNYGFFVQAEHKFKLDEKFWMKIYANYENIKISKLSERGSYYYVVGGGPYSTVKGNANWESFAAGIGLIF